MPLRPIPVTDGLQTTEKYVIRREIGDSGFSSEESAHGYENECSDEDDEEIIGDGGMYGDVDMDESNIPRFMQSTRHRHRRNSVHHQHTMTRRRSFSPNTGGLYLQELLRHHRDDSVSVNQNGDIEPVITVESSMSGGDGPQFVSFVRAHPTRDSDAMDGFAVEVTASDDEHEGPAR